MEQQPTQTYKISFHKSNGHMDGEFINVPYGLINIILNTLPKRWIAVIYNNETEKPITVFIK